MDIMRALVPVIKDYKNDIVLLGHVINGRFSHRPQSPLFSL
jgi:hypothetical protein